MKIKIKNLNRDSEILAIRNVNPLFVSRYRQAMRQGDQFPPIIIDGRTKTVVSGYHRLDSYEQEYGEDYTIEVVSKTYATEADRIEEAVRENSKHGNPLDGISRRRAALRLAELGRDADAIAKLLGVSVKRVEKMGDQVVCVRGISTPQPVKRGLEHMRGETVSAKDYKNHIAADRGVPAVAIANQLNRWFENGWVAADEKTFEAIEKLYNNCTEYISKHGEWAKAVK
jgi:hypothetical protein